MDRWKRLRFIPQPRLSPVDSEAESKCHKLDSRADNHSRSRTWQATFRRDCPTDAVSLNTSGSARDQPARKGLLRLENARTVSSLSGRSNKQQMNGSCTSQTRGYSYSCIRGRKLSSGKYTFENNDRRAYDHSALNTESSQHLLAGHEDPSLLAILSGSVKINEPIDSSASILLAPKPNTPDVSISRLKTCRQKARSLARAAFFSLTRRPARYAVGSAPFQKYAHHPSCRSNASMDLANTSI